VKQLLLTITCISFLGFAGTAFAVKEKATIWHCGCAADGESLEWHKISVSTRALGHENHFVGSEKTCYDSETGEEALTLTRNADDCVSVESENLLGDVPLCGEVEPVQGDPCSDAE